jgi:hypothetical protein
MRKKVWAERAAGTDNIIRIFKSQKAAFESRIFPNFLVEVLYEAAVFSVRHQLFVRSGGFCEWCGDILTEQSGHMHERKHRGKGGEISLENSAFICAKTHKDEHADRNPHWSKK